MTFIDDATEHAWFRIDDASAAGTVRRAAVRLAEHLGFDAERAGEVGIVATELASNLTKHAVEGNVILRVVRSVDVAGLQVLSIDSGPGMADPRLSSEDGRSTSGSLGIGLGAVSRLASAVDGFSLPERGTVVLATVWRERGEPELRPRAPAAATLTRPMSGESVCGDAGAIRIEDDGAIVVILADGLGHGSLAAAASQEAVRLFRDARGTPAELVSAVHDRLRSTRGAAVAVARIDGPARMVTFAGIGNISGWIVDGDRRSGLSSLPGIAGHQARKVREFRSELPRSATIVLHSDGLTDKWDLTRYAGLRARDPAVIAATLLRDAGVRHDDASVLVVKTT
jgi:anti-sigma regulatory factor (Ser/Thr protein kinase)